MWMKRYIKRHKTFFNRHQVNRYHESMVGIYINRLCFWVLTGLLRRYALAKSLIDVPNERSSHAVPTPRGGGISIVITFLAGYGIFMADVYFERYGICSAIRCRSGDSYHWFY